MADLESPEYLNRLREQVRDWIGYARKAVNSFCNAKEGWFWRDSKKMSEENPKPSITTTARCYMALVYAEQSLGKGRNGEDWVDWLRLLASKFDFAKECRFDITEPKVEDDPREKLNFFETAHLADLLFTLDIAKKFRGAGDLSFNGLDGPLLLRTLNERIEKFSETSEWADGRFPFEQGPKSDPGNHYFVSLHCLRALRILNADDPQAIAIKAFRNGQGFKAVRQFCIEQCYNSHQRLPHCQDSIQLAFACCIHGLYAQPVQSDLCEAVVTALEGAQQENGTWPATHPIFRGESRGPWHITSHEVGLCLTWLYFSPSIRDAARLRLLAMMERYFKKWVIPSFIDSLHVPPAQELSGWYDDHHAGANHVAGWATAIVCHFLANYCRVLDNCINRRVIESLGIEETANYYLIDNSLTTDSRWQWQGDSVPTWFDLPPFALADPINPKGGTSGVLDHTQIAEKIDSELKKEWTDPTDDERICTALATKMVAPVLTGFGQRPSEKCSALIIHGPPGTRKSTLVKEIAKRIRWTRLTIPASVIFSEGWDRMEARASVVFRRLCYLTECVIFFDEFEEFFRERGSPRDAVDQQVASGRSPSPAASTVTNVGSRTLAAFVTSAMLPRMQELRDTKRNIVILATNYFDDIDKAARRPGRFNFHMEIPHPRKKRALSYAKNPSYRTKAGKREDQSVSKHIYEPVQDVLRILLSDEATMPFEAIEAALEYLAEHSLKGSEAQDAVRRILEQKKKNELPGILEDTK